MEGSGEIARTGGQVRIGSAAKQLQCLRLRCRRECHIGDADVVGTSSHPTAEHKQQAMRKFEESLLEMEREGAGLVASTSNNCVSAFCPPSTPIEADFSPSLTIESDPMISPKPLSSDGNDQKVWRRGTGSNRRIKVLQTFIITCEPQYLKAFRDSCPRFGPVLVRPPSDRRRCQNDLVNSRELNAGANLFNGVDGNAKAASESFRDTLRPDSGPSSS